MRIAVDFDGVIIKAKKDYSYEDRKEFIPIPGAIESLEKLIRLGHQIIIWSSRAAHCYGDDAQSMLQIKLWNNMLDYIKSNKVPYSEVDSGECGKIMADMYIDDRAVRFTDWENVFDFVTKLKTEEYHILVEGMEIALVIPCCLNGKMGMKMKLA
jgi:hypothetical protein